MAYPSSCQYDILANISETQYDSRSDDDSYYHIINGNLAIKF